MVCEVTDLTPDETGPRASLAEMELTTVSAAFDLGEVVDTRDIGGTYNLNVLLQSSSGAYVVRVHRPWVTLERLRGIQQARAALARAGMPVPQPLATATGDTMLAWAGRLVEVERFVAHDGVADSWPRYEQAFSLLGALHDALVVGVPMPLVPARASNYGTPPQLMRWMERTEATLQRDQGEPGADEALATCRQARDLVRRFGDWWHWEDGSLPAQPIHGDYGGENLLFRDEQIVAILDFDFLDTRERIFELAYTTYGLLARLAPGTTPDNYPWAKAATLLAVYNGSTSQPLSEQEWKALPMEMARVPLYWIAEAGFTPDPVRAVSAMSSATEISRWLLNHAVEVARSIEP